MDSDLHRQGGDDRTGDRRDFFRHRAAVRVAEHHGRGAGPGGGPHRLKRVFGVGLVSVEEVFGVENQFAAGVFQETDRVADHRQVLFEAGPQNLGDLEGRGFPDDRDHPGSGLKERPKAGVVFRARASAAGHAERADLDVLQLQLGNPLEVLEILLVRAGIASFDEIEAKAVEALGQEQFVLNGKTDPLRLGTVAQRGVVNL